MKANMVTDLTLLCDILSTDRGLKGHKVSKGKKDPKGKGFLDQRYYFNSIIRD